MSPNPAVAETLKRVDLHFHVGVRGDQHPQWGHISDRMRAMWPRYQIFLLYAGVKEGQDVDDLLIGRTADVIRQASLDHVVCLAMDHVWDPAGRPRKDLTDFWVANEYVLELQQRVGPKVLFGASVHPYRPDFRARVTECIQHGAVFIKWLPSSQQF